VKKVLIPSENRKDLKDVPDKILRLLEVVPVEHMDEVVSEAICPPEDPLMMDVKKDENPFAGGGEDAIVTH
jgi:ATP-dependent Lon protease